MDRHLIAWGLRMPGGRWSVPRLWLFTDLARVPDPRPVAARLPAGRAGIVFRHDSAADRATLGRDLARICRARRLAMVVAGDVRLAATLRVGLHLRAGRYPEAVRSQLVRRRGIVTSSAHTVADLLRARRAGAGLAFLSPAYGTASHPGAAGLGPLRWALLARRVGVKSGSFRIGALGGVDGQTVRRLPGWCAAIGAITAFSD